MKRRLLVCLYIGLGLSATASAQEAAFVEEAATAWERNRAALPAFEATLERVVESLVPPDARKGTGKTSAGDPVAVDVSSSRQRFRVGRDARRIRVIAEGPTPPAESYRDVFYDGTAWHVLGGSGRTVVFPPGDMAGLDPASLPTLAEGDFARMLREWTAPAENIPGQVKVTQQDVGDHRTWLIVERRSGQQAVVQGVEFSGAPERLPLRWWTCLDGKLVSLGTSTWQSVPGSSAKLCTRTELRMTPVAPVSMTPELDPNLVRWTSVARNTLTDVKYGPSKSLEELLVAPDSGKPQ